MIALLALAALPTSAWSQDRPDPAPAPPPSRTDTVRAPAVPVQEGPSPRGAFLRSMAVPGWGQAWVGSPVRGGVYFALESGALWMTYKSMRKLREAREEEAWLHDTGQLARTQQYPLVTARRAQVEDWTTLAIFFLFFAGADAFVAAHMADFVDHVAVSPDPAGGVRLQASFPVGGLR
jgi:hypothetical protein